jgi:hypothetical protein
MGFNSYDELVSEMTAGKTTGPVTWNKLVPAAHTAGRWYDFQALAGTPIANAWAGTALNWVTCTGATGNGTQIFGLPMGGDVTPDTKHLINAMALTPGVVPGVLMLVDLQGYYPGISLNSAVAQTMVGTPTLRYANGAGVRAYFVITGGTVGATAHNLAMSYTDQSGNAGNTLPVTVSCTASTIATHITHSGTAANNYGPFLPLANGDSGIRSVQTVTFSASSVGTAPLGALCLARPLLTLPITTTGVAVERDLVNQIPSMPMIPDGACLVWLYFAGGTTAANTNFYGTLEAAWS